MDFWSSMRVLARRWYVVLLGLIVTSAVVAMVFRAVPPTYSAVSQQVFLASPAGAVEPGTAKGQIASNPLLELGSGYNVLAELIAKMMNGEQGQLAVQKAGGDGDYIVDTVSGDAPVVSITVDATSPEAALDTEKVVRKVMAQTLEAQQRAAGADSRTFVIVHPVFEPTQAVYAPASRVRAGGALFVVGLALTLGLVFFVESVAERRRRGPDRHPGRVRGATLGARDVEVFPQQQTEAGATRG
jgi:capsular polysaccharide biosynthesis protein